MNCAQAPLRWQACPPRVHSQGFHQQWNEAELRSSAPRPPQAHRRPRLGGFRRRPWAAASSAAAPGAGTAPLAQHATALLDWLVQQQGAAPSCLKVERRFGGEKVGYALVATADIEPEEVILSVPLTAAITSEGVDESRWSIHMAAQLLERSTAAEAAVAAGDGAAAVRAGQAWLNALPAHVDLPWLYWSDAELAELQDGDTLAEAQHLRSVFEAACQELGTHHPPEAVAWALSMVHSRSFVQQDCHVWVPGIDLCNHTLENNADIRCVHSPGSCQGAAALDEVCPPETAAAQCSEPSRFELVAGEAGVAAGQEVTISYGSWPSDVFLLFFGFAPADNPHDSAVLFYDLFDLASFRTRLVAGQAAKAAVPAAGAQQQDGWMDERQWEQLEAAVGQLEARLGVPREQYVRMVATAAGMDARLLEAAQALLMAGRGTRDGRAMTLPEFLEHRCRELLGAYPTSLQEDEQLMRQLQQQQQQQQQLGGAAAAEEAGQVQAQLVPAPGVVRRPQLEAALRYRMGKKQVLTATLAAVARRQH